jgi:hypothetical protein
VNRATLERRNYDLVIFHLGTLSQAKDYPDCQEKIVARHRAALPGVPILIMSPPDFLDTPIKSAPWVPQVRDIERSWSLAHGLAFWDFLKAMGDPGGMMWFEKEDLSIHDMVHLSEKGGEYMGGRVVYAMLKDFTAYLSANPRAGCDGGAMKE